MRVTAVKPLFKAEPAATSVLVLTSASTSQTAMEHLGKPGFGIEQPASENWSGVVPSRIFYPLNDLLAMLFCDAWVPFFQNHDHYKSWYASNRGLTVLYCLVLLQCGHQITAHLRDCSIFSSLFSTLIELALYSNFALFPPSVEPEVLFRLNATKWQATPG